MEQARRQQMKQPARRNLVAGTVDPVKLMRARELRQRMTPSERALWQALRGHRCNGLQFRRQHVLEGFIVDFYCHAAGLVVELDGPIHQQQAGYDHERDRILAERGLRTVRVKNEELAADLPGVLARIAAAAAGEPPPPPAPPPGGEGSVALERASAL
jgi:very-short-patch-repair endonuclease